ncbi:MAG: crossover junction endodeoxyribonuclease RuvC [Candidatus Sericytochromatia bacterium]|nr:crossover junction endodeoxyribonuclease RuvC [Candidatus Sericytochromatia bacterium]
MRILGIDPGLATVGYGVIDTTRGRSPACIAAGAVVTPRDRPLAERLLEIQRDLADLLKEFCPDEVAVEELFFVNNITTGMQVAMARGCILATLAGHGLAVHAYVPMAVKQAVTGSGRSPKREVQEGVRHMLRLERLPKPDDAADALAVALCHHQHRGVLGATPGRAEGAQGR